MKHALATALGALAVVAVWIAFAGDTPKASMQIDPERVPGIVLAPRSTHPSEVSSRPFDPQPIPTNPDASGERSHPSSELGPAAATERPWVIRVVDPDGKPVRNLRVGLLIQAPRRAGRETLQYFTSRDAGTITLTQSALGELARVGNRIRVIPDVIGPEPIVSEFELGPDREPMVIEIPRTGRIELRVVSTLQDTVHGEFPLNIHTSEGHTKRVSLRPQHEKIEAPESRKQAWECSLPHVALGLSLKFEVPLSDLHARHEFEVAGPVLPGEVIRANLTLTKDVPRIRFTLTDESGSTVNNERLSVGASLIDPDVEPYAGNLTLSTDPEGRVEITVTPEFVKSVRNCYALTLIACNIGMVELFLPDTMRDGDLDLGTIPMTMLPSLLAGVVVDETGLPVAAATVSCQPWIHPLDEGGDQAAAITTKTDLSGNFTVRGLTVDEHLAISVQHADMVSSPPTRVQRGQSGLRIELARAGSVEGNFLSTGNTKRITLELTRVCTAGSDRHVFNPENWRDLEAVVPFRFANLVPGTYRLRVLVTAVADYSLLDVPDIQVEAGLVLRDPRLHLIDVHRATRRLRLRVESREGKPVAKAWVMLAASDQLGGRVAMCDANGCAEFSVGPQPFFAVGGADGFESSTPVQVRSDVTLRLRPTRPAVFYVPKIRELPPNFAAGWTAELRRPPENSVGQGTAAPDASEATIGNDGRASVPLRFRGAAVLTLRRWRPTVSREDFAKPYAYSQNIEIPLEGDGLEFTVDIPDDEMPKIRAPQ